MHYVKTEWMAKFKRQSIKDDDDQENKSLDSLLNFETVKCFANEKYEAQRYHEGILKNQVCYEL